MRGQVGVARGRRAGTAGLRLAETPYVATTPSRVGRAGGGRGRQGGHVGTF